MEAEWVSAMRRGDDEAAWAINDLVLAGRDRRFRDDPRLPYHLRWIWGGEAFTGADVLVRCYHGLGDTLMFARYLAPVRALARSLTVEAQPALCPIIARMGVADRVVPFDLGAPLPPAACTAEIMELPHALRLTPEAAARPPYLHAHSPGTSGGIGVCWQGGDWDPERSLPHACAAALLAGMNDPPVLLQPHATDLPVANPKGCSASIEDTASVIAGLQLVITIDSMVAHLAGALNRPTWLLLKHDADWRWMADRDDSPWYPAMRLFRQPSPGDWDSIIAAVTRELGAWPKAMPVHGRSSR